MIARNLRWIFVCVLVAQASVLVYLARTNSPTWDEPAHLVAGLSHWEFGKFDLYSVNPPLVRTLAAAPVHFFMQPKLNWVHYSSNPSHRSEVSLGHDFVELNGARTWSLFFVARLMVIPITLLGTVLCYLFARDIFSSRAAGLGAAILWACSPSVLGHGALIAPDAATAVTGMAAAYMFWQFLKKPGFSQALVLAAVTAMAMLTKSTWLILPLVFLIAWAIVQLAPRFFQQLEPSHASKQPPKIVLAGLVGAMVVALAFVNGFYGFDGSFTPLKKFTFVSRSLADASGERLPSTARPLDMNSRLVVPAAANQPLTLNKVANEPPAKAATEGAHSSAAEPACPHCAAAAAAEKAGASASAVASADIAACPDCARSANATATIDASGTEVKYYDVRPGNRYAKSILGNIPVPLPKRYLEGIDIQRRDFESGMYRPEWASYFGGTWQLGGWWYFYIVGLFHKSPLAFWLLLGLGSLVAVQMRGKSTALGAVCLWVPALLLLFILSANTGLNRYLRYALPLMPALCIWAGAAFVVFSRDVNVRAWMVRPLQGAAIVLLGLYVGATTLSAPHWLSYFNSTVGGSSQGYVWYTDSNVDWGQDLGRVAKWIERHPEIDGKISLGYFGSFNPASLGIDFKPPVPNTQDLAMQVMLAPEQTDPRPGWFIISKNYIVGHPMPLPAPDGTLRFFQKSPLQFFQKLKPVDEIGHSMFVYHLDQTQADQYRMALGFPVASPLEHTALRAPTAAPAPRGNAEQGGSADQSPEEAEGLGGTKLSRK